MPFIALVSMQMALGALDSAVRRVRLAALPGPDTPIGEVGQADPAPVVMVHGYLDTWLAPWWTMLARRLVDAGWPEDKLYHVDTGVTVGAPSEYADDIQTVLERATDAHGRPAGLLCHSMGGLSGRWCVEHGAGAPLVEDLVTVATPHRGTYSAYLGFLTAGGRSMVPQSSFIQDLNDGGLAESVRYTAIGSSGDRLIVPAESAFLPVEVAHDDTTNVDIDSGHHVRLLQDSRALRTYVDRLP